MSSPERLVFRRQAMVPEEIVVTVYDDGMDAMRDCAVPRERDVALALASVSDGWFDRFMAELQEVSMKRALLVSRVVERIEFAPSSGAVADVAGGDIDPGFGADPKDSARLLELYQAIDAIGWRGHADEERGNYLERLKQIREEMAQGDSLAIKNMRLQKQVLQQRAELRRFNREARARNEAAAACAGSIMRFVASTALKGGVP